MTRVLVGDVGGTHVRLATIDLTIGPTVFSDFEKFRSDDFSDFYSVLKSYLKTESRSCNAALFALAGPPRGRSISLTNRLWTVSSDRLEREFDFEKATLVNDFTAMARSIPEVSADAFSSLKTGVANPDEPVLVIGPGTGLGIASLLKLPGGGWHVIGGEGGHGAFAPSNDEEWELCKILRRERDYVPNELICAGIGFNELHRAVSELNGVDHEHLSPGEVSDRAADGDALCLQICRLRARTVMTVAGDIALANGAKGGVVIAGGASVKLSSYLREEGSIDRFTARGIQTNYMSEIPIRLLVDEQAPLVGAAALFADFVEPK
ncbi:MAG: glucokinase [Pseudomonadota bacterium]